MQKYILIYLLLGSTLCFSQQVKDTKFQPDRGFYDSPVEVKITTSTPGASIRYTLDASPPSHDHGRIYDSPIHVTTTTVIRAIAYKNGMEPTNVDTHTYIFLDDVITQPSNPSGFPSRWYNQNGSSVPADYEMDPNYPSSDEQLKKGLLDLPTVSLVLHEENLWGNKGIINNGGKGNNNQFEKPCSFEIIYPHGRNSYQVNCGIQPRARRDYKHGVRLDFKSEYGPGRLKYDIFEGAWAGTDNAANSYNHLVFRTGSFENYTSGGYDHSYTILFRDPMSRNVQLKTSGIGARNLMVHLYFNGLYWGIYNLTEFIDPDYLTDYFGGQEKDWMRANARPGTQNTIEIDGDPKRWQELLTLVQSEDLTDSTLYARVLQYIDPVRFADYMIIQNYNAIGDWPDNNWYFVIKGGINPEPGFFIMWDAEKTWLEGDDPQSHKHAWYNPFLTDPNLWEGEPYNNPLSIIWRAMISNAEFRLLFADRVYKHLFHDGPLTDKNALNLFKDWALLLTDAIRAEQKRWADHTGKSFTHDDWQREVNWVIGNITNQNVNAFISEFGKAGLYPSIHPPQFSQRGGYVSNGFQFTVTNPNESGTIYYTTDNSDPRAYGGEISKTSIECEKISTSITISQTSTVKARVLDNSEWSALEKAVFYTPTDYSAIKITEIMYHPPDTAGIDGDEFEFIEIKNTSQQPVDLTGVSFTDGINYSFPEGTIISGGSFLVLCENKDMFYYKYHIKAFGQYSGRLSNGGEKVTLSDPYNQPIFSVEYDDQFPWPTTPDGDGYSLVPIDFNKNQNPDNPINWRASLYPMGSPGLDDSTRYIIPEYPDEKTGDILFIVKNGALNEGDKKLYDHLTNKGYKVEISDEFTRALLALDFRLVIISSTANSDFIDNGYTSLNVPIITWNPDLFYDLNMTGDVNNSDFGKVRDREIIIGKQNHPLAAGLTDTVQIATSINERPFGLPALNYSFIAYWKDHVPNAAIFAYEKGKTMVGCKAPAKRIGFFFGSDIKETTFAGWHLFDAAVFWAAGISPVHNNEGKVSHQFKLYQNYPNPFNNRTAVQFILNQAAFVRLDIFNIQGQLVKNVLVEQLNSGHHRFYWDATDKYGKMVGSGIYIMKLNTKNKKRTFSRTLKMVYTK